MARSQNKIDMTGRKIGKLTVLAIDTTTKSGNLKWLCQCECGNIASVNGSKLRAGRTKSCGCLRKSESAGGYSKTRLYVIWRGMHNRCYNPKHDSYKWYGQRGIEICEEWHTFLSFRKWALSNGYDESLSIDRINSDGNYHPSNCQWQTQKQQMNNVSSNHIIQYDGKEYSMAQFADNYHFKYHTVVNRLKMGWSIEKIIRTPETRGCYGK